MARAATTVAVVQTGDNERKPAALDVKSFQIYFLTFGFDGKQFI